MNKWVWAVPIALIVITAVAVGLLGARDVDLDQCIYDTKLSEAVSVSDTDALRILDTNRSIFDTAYDECIASAAPVTSGELSSECILLGAMPSECIDLRCDVDTIWFVLEDKPGAFVAIAKGASIPAAAENLGADGYNISRVQSELLGGWIYYAEYARAITFRDTYLERLEDGLTAEQKAQLTPNAISEAALVFKDVANAPFPAEYCRGKYALCAVLEQIDGGEMTVILDPKTKAFLGTGE